MIFYCPICHGKESPSLDSPIFDYCKKNNHGIKSTLQNKISGVSWDLPKKTQEEYNNKTKLVLERMSLEQRSRQNSGSEPKLSEYADSIMGNHIFKTMSDTEEILWHDNGVYRPNAEAIIKSDCEKLVQDCSKYKVSEVMAIIQRRTLTDRKEFNKDLTKLVFNNGILDLNSGEFNPQHDPEFLTTIKLNYDYNPAAKCPKFLQLLNDCLGDDTKKIVQLVELMSNVLTMNQTNFETSLIMVGGGANGKSTFLKILRGIFGAENTTAISIHAIQKERFSIALLNGKLANIYADISNAELWSLGKFKQVVSGDLIEVESKHVKHFKMKSFAKHFFSANEMPDIKDSTDGAFRRIQVIKFENEFRTDLNNCIQDYDKIILAEESSGIFNLLFWNYKNIMKYGFRFKQSIADVRNTIKRESDKLREYLDTCCKENTASYIKSEEIYQKYVEYCKFHGYDPYTQKKFSTNLSLYGLKPGQKKIDGKNYKIWYGREWNYDDEWIKSNIRKPEEVQTSL